MTMSVSRGPVAALLFCAATAGADVWDVQDNDDDTATSTRNALRHGADQIHDLAVRPGPVADLSSCSQLAGQSGHMIIGHDGGYGGLAVKAVAVEPATGFTFDTQGVSVPH